MKTTRRRKKNLQERIAVIGISKALSQTFTHESIVHRDWKGLSSLPTYPPAEISSSFNPCLPLVLLLLSSSVPFCASCKLLLRTLPLRLSLRGSGS